MKQCLKRVLATNLIVALAVLVASCGGGNGTAAKATPLAGVQTPASQAQSNPDSLAINGTLAPARHIKLSFQVSGQVIETAEIGDAVQAGQMLVRLDDTDAKLNLVQANAALKMAQAQLAQQKAGVKPSEIAAAEQVVKEAEGQVWNASAQLAQLQSGARAGDLATAQAEVARMAASLKQAQDAYDGVVEGRAAAKEYGIQAGGLGMAEEQMRIHLAAARAAYEAAQKQLVQLQAGATKNEIDASRATLAAMQAQKARAQAQLDSLKAGATPEQIAVSEANVAQAQAAVDLAQAALDKTLLKAPFAGTVVDVFVRAGEVATVGAPVLELADTTRWRVETSNMSELQIAKVKVGQKAKVTVNAFSDQELTGQVVGFSPIAIVQQGDTTYTITIELSETNLPLRWGMTAKVRILV
jgi:HlyD family secretion protein